MIDCFMDLETRSPVPIKHGTYRYAEQAEILLWAYAIEDGPVKVWDVASGDLIPVELLDTLKAQDALIWFHNGGQFDFVVLDRVMPKLAALVPQDRRRDTMVQAYCHGLPGALHTLGDVLKLDQDKRKLKTGKDLMRRFCIPRPKNEKLRWHTRETHPAEWALFVEYAGQDIEAMRAVHHQVPMWNYKGSELALWHLDCKINQRGAYVDQELARAALQAAGDSLDALATETAELTDGAVASTTQRDAMLAHILEAHGVTLPDMQKDTLERRLNDPDLPQAVRDLIAIRLQASMNSSSKYTALLNGVSSDGRLRGLAQFRGASRTGRWGHRMFQPGNLMRPPIDEIAAWHRIDKSQVKDEHIHAYIDTGIRALLAGAADLTHG